ncbi:energy transducer TonB [Helicobacter sp.]|uniref:energy transducer TonB n=1 Tax=Helicobacter sp. TaxID=218 RepID=UPI0025B81495|nr:energy transducer TonB [Helicobacter sp.]MCI5968070.1 energy transducer TonB [Helicobacter sp.]MDY2584045.1 energy transducer TonB [Helicobacter sp.]
MNIFLNHKSQAFYITSFCFLPLFLGFLYSISVFKVAPQKQESFNLAMQQFITQAPKTQEIPKITQTPQPKPIQPQTKPKTQEMPKPIPKKPKELPSKNPAKTYKQTPPAQPSNPTATPQPHTSQMPAVSPIPTEEFVEILSFGKDNHPFLKAVKQAIDSNISYPRQARKMHIQGEVIVEFLWTKDKILKDLKVRKSSSHPILDASALKTIQKASLHFPAHTNDVHLQIPIVFMLKRF